jgi:uncharacterized protein YndB with AHSA1/START domain
MTDETRSIEREIVIGADPERVWQAITEAEEIVNWFALEADSEPGIDGYIDLRWNLKSHEAGRCHILEWDPGRRLLMTWRDGPAGDHPLPVEIRLERREGGTLLRLVHSGFLADESWDEEYESHGRGWSYELRSLRHYLERYPGRRREHVLARFPVGDDPERAWRTVAGPAGAFGYREEGAAKGGRFPLVLPDGTSSTAELVFAFHGRDFVVASDVLRGGLFRLALERLSGTPQLWIWAFSWRMSGADLEAVVRPIYEAVHDRMSQPDSSAFDVRSPRIEEKHR